MNEAGEPDLAWAEGCPCGEVHLVSPQVTENIAAIGPTVMLTVMGFGAWIVPRIYIAAHVVRPTDVPLIAEQYGWERVG